VDHVDGLYDPGEYLRRLQRRCRPAKSTDGAEAAVAAADGCERRFFVVVEKVLGTGESLPADWAGHGKTGDGRGAVVHNLFVDGRNERALDDIYTRFVRERGAQRGGRAGELAVGERLSFADLVYRCKKQVLHLTMSGDINSLGHQLNRFSERNRHFRDF